MNLDIHDFVSSNCIFICGFSAKVTCAFLTYKKQRRHSQNKTLFDSGNRHILDTFYYRGTVQGYRCTVQGYRTGVPYRGTVVNRKLLSLHREGHFKLRFAVPLSKRYSIFFLNFIKISKFTTITKSNYFLLKT